MRGKRPRLLDMFCGEGGASLGYYGAGFDVVGVDINPQPRYPFPFIEGDVTDEDVWNLALEFDAIHASPPCQSYSKNVKHLSLPVPRLIGLVRLNAIDLGLPFVIENVEGAPLRCPVELCGRTLGLRLKRHRLFECSFGVFQPPCRCQQSSSKPINVYDSQGVARVRAEFPGEVPERVFAREMGVRWMSKHGAREAIPPVYTRHIGRYMMQRLKS